MAENIVTTDKSYFAVSVYPGQGRRRVPNMVEWHAVKADTAEGAIEELRTSHRWLASHCTTARTDIPADLLGWRPDGAAEGTYRPLLRLVAVLASGLDHQLSMLLFEESWR